MPLPPLHMPSRLSDEQITKKLRAYPDWEYDEKSLVRDFEFDEYTEGLDLLNEIAEISEVANHHPEMVLGWCQLRVSFRTHSAGGVTDNDFELLSRIDDVVE